MPSPHNSNAAEVRSNSIEEPIDCLKIAACPDSLRQWFEAQKDPLYSFVFFRVAQDEELAIEITQATFAKALDKISAFDATKGSMQNWLRFLSRNIIRDHLVAKNRGAQWLAFWDEIDEKLHRAFERIDKAPLPDEVIAREETRQLVAVTLANLPNHYREVLEAKYIDNLSLDSIATKRKTTIDGVKSMLRRSRIAFRECFLTLSKMEFSDVGR